MIKGEKNQTFSLDEQTINKILTFHKRETDSNNTNNVMIPM